MKITDVEVIRFRTETINHRSRWGFLVLGEPVEAIESVVRITTNEGHEGCMLATGGNLSALLQWIKPMLIGEDPLDHGKFWTWMNQMVTQSPELGPTELEMGVVDCALWDLAGKIAGLPVHKMLGSTRDRVKAYASGYPDLGPPETYAKHALDCRDHGYKAYKVHAYLGQKQVPGAEWKWERAPQHPGNPVEEVEVCRAIREAVGDDMVLMLDPFGAFTLDESIWVAQQLEELNYYWLEHPMLETRMEAYRRLTESTSVNILAPEHLGGGVYTRAEWITQRACDMIRIGSYDCGGLTACHKMANVCEAYGVKCELHGGGWAHLQVFGSTNEETCEYFERGLLTHDVAAYETPPPYLKEIADPMDEEGNVLIPQEPGIAIDLNWDYINDNLVTE
jgi:L-alanine-DL-glutamate epimerase-like enolase superfamily enzyme